MQVTAVRSIPVGAVVSFVDRSRKGTMAVRKGIVTCRGGRSYRDTTVHVPKVGYRHPAARDIVEVLHLPRI